MPEGSEAKAWIRQLPSGFWAVFIDGIWVDAASPSKQAAQDKLKLFLNMRGEPKQFATHYRRY